MSLTILLAGALRSAPDPDIEPSPPRKTAVASGLPPRLSRLLGRSDTALLTASERLPDTVLTIESGEEAWLRSQFSLSDAASVAAAAGCTAGAREGTLLLRLVHLHPGLDHIVLDPPVSLEVGDAESDALLQATRDWLSDEPIALRALSSTVWELTETNPAHTRFAELKMASASRASGRNIDIWLPRGPSARNWRRLMNEIQMLWHSHPVNASRIEAGAKPINALWLEGVIPDSAKTRFDRVLSSDPVLSGLARLAGARTDTAADPASVLAIEANNTVLIDAPFWRHGPGEASQPHPSARWHAFEGWFDGLRDRLSLGASRECRLVLTGESAARTFILTRRANWRLWRRSIDPEQLDDPVISQR